METAHAWLLPAQLPNLMLPTVSTRQDRIDNTPNGCRDVNSIPATGISSRRSWRSVGLDLRDEQRARLVGLISALDPIAKLNKPEFGTSETLFQALKVITNMA